MIWLAAFLVSAAVALVVGFVVKVNRGLDARADAWRRNHAHRRRFWE